MGIMRACVFEGSDRARALLYDVIEENRDKHRSIFEAALKIVEDTFKSMKQYDFNLKELDLENGALRIKAVRKVLGDPQAPEVSTRS